MKRVRHRHIPILYLCFSPVARILLIETSSIITLYVVIGISFSPVARILLIETAGSTSRLQQVICFSPVARILLIETMLPDG